MERHSMLRLRKNSIPTEWRPVGKVAKICIFPFKSGRRIEVEQAECSKQGLSWYTMQKITNTEMEDSIQKWFFLRFGHMIIIVAPEMRTLELRLPSKKEQPEVMIK
ncbi:hypothetical protein NQ317_006493 [Molorchus minor]|uniref:Uncharacterized protein n=1 Tax=Molorchus minor TaxID=1323400 RepID=A0ABQ9IQD1_9CUCU|nr:hypothetical protein NQ317_006493 [Molorchus minor]